MPFSLLRDGLRAPALRAALGTTVAASLLLGCSAEIEYPGKEAVIRAAGPGCTVVSVQAMEHLPETRPGYRRVAYPYMANCVPEGGATARRVRARVVYEEYSAGEMMGGGKFWNSTRELLDDPAETRARGTRTVTLHATDCTAYVQRIVNEVLPCLQEQMPALVAPLQEQVDTHLRRATVEVVTSNRAVAEMEHDAQCLQRWRQINRQLPSGNAPGACGLKD